MITGELRDNTVQTIPYPVFAWQWRPRQSYSWHNSQHINMLEFLAFLNYIRNRTGKPGNHGIRFVHILDSRVVSCVLAKGRSSSFMLFKQSCASRVCPFNCVGPIPQTPLDDLGLELLRFRQPSSCSLSWSRWLRHAKGIAELQWGI